MTSQNNLKGCDFIENLAYSLHLGSDKNKKNNVRKSAKTNKSGTTSMSNNAIQNYSQWSRVDKHNYRKYDNSTDNIEIIRGTNSLVDDIKKLYIEEFEKSKSEYNNRQIREDRKIDNYFNHISNNSKNDLACEIIIELGDKKYWDTKDIAFKKRMSNVYKKQVEDLEIQLPNFKIASAIIHYDETSPHMHIVGVPIKYKNKNGMSKQVGKSNVFTKDSLSHLQDKMKILCIESFNKEYSLNNGLKDKLKGRNIDILSKDMVNYQLMKDELDNNRIKLDNANKKSLKLDNNSIDIEKIVNNLKSIPVIKGNYILNKNDKEKILSYINAVKETNKEYKNIQTLSITLNNIDEELKNNKEKIKTLSENNSALELRVSTLNKSIKEKDENIKDLEKENISLANKLEYWKNKFMSIVRFIRNKLFSKKEQDKYYDVSLDLYNHSIIDNETFYKLKDDYDYLKVRNFRKKDDLER